MLSAEAGGLKDQAAQLSSAYDRAQSSADVSLAAYVATRLPATFAAVSRVLELVDEVVIGFKPKSMLDVGAGPGTASWAAVEQWPGLAKLTMVERDGRFADLAKAFSRSSDDEALKSAVVEQSDLNALKGQAELVIAAYVFAEQRQELAGDLALKLWGACTGLLVIIEPGTPDGFARIRAARAALLGAGAHMVGPCTQAHSCPMAGDDWCHFKTRLQRSRHHMQAKGATVPFEDESFAFVAVSRSEVALPQTRIIAPPATNKVGTTLRLCGHSGVEELVIASRDKPAYKLSKKKSWGDSWG